MGFQPVPPKGFETTSIVAGAHDSRPAPSSNRRPYGSQNARGLFLGRAIQMNPGAALADALDLGWRFARALPKGCKQLVGHIRGDVVSHAAASFIIAVEKALDCIKTDTRCHEMIHQRGHIGAAIRFEDLDEAGAVFARAT